MSAGSSDPLPHTADASELLARMIESVKDYAIFTLDCDRQVTSWNPGAERLFGYPEEEIMGQSGDILYTPEDQAQEVPQQEAEKAAREGRAEDKRWHVRRDGSRFFAAGMVRPLLDESGRLIGFTKVAQDITEHRRAETALQQQANLLDLSHDAILVWRLDGAISYWNQGAELLYGFPREMAMGRSPHDLLQTRQAGDALEFIHQLKRDGRWSGELCHRHRDGHVLLVESRQVLIQQPDGESLVLESNRDVTKRDRVEEALREREAQLQLAIAIAEMGTFEINLATDAVRVNEIGRAIYGWPPGEALTFSKVQTHFHPDDREVVLRRVGAALDPAGEGRFQVEQRIFRTDGAVRWIRVFGQAFFEGEGAERKAVRCMGTYTDVTPLKEAEVAQREANRRKDEFLAMLAHELRNPLAAIRNALRVWDSPQLDAESLQWAKGVLERQSGQLTRLVDDLLDVSRITSGKIRLKKEVLDAAALLDHAAELVRPLVAAREHTLETRYPRDGSLLIEADATRLEQIIGNLLTNAAKYMENGGTITLSAQREAEEIAISVRDTGFGIPAEKLPEMFELFAQGERSIARSEGGLGLGLTIVRTLVEMHGGSVIARSEGAGKGSEFLVRLPPAASASRAPAALSPAATGRAHEPGARVLVVDDNVDTAEGVARLLKRKGFTVAVAHDGLRAVDAARQVRPQFVLLDIGLPEMDGYEVVARLRREVCCEGALFVAISGYGQEEDRRRSKEAGFDHHLVKPMDFEQLLGILASHA